MAPALNADDFMSLCIDSRYITGIYALGQWFKVEKGSVDVDAYEFTNWEGDPSGQASDRWDVDHTDYQLGDLYPDNPNGTRGRYREDSRGYYSSPSGCHGISFIDADTAERVSFSLMEVRAFREQRA